jgi:putative transposase
MLNISALCSAFGFTRQAYYKLRKSKSKERIKNEKVLEMVKKVRKRQSRLGTEKVYNRIKITLIEQEIKMGRDKLNGLLRDEQMLVGKKKNHTRTTNSYHRYRKWSNLLKDMELTRPEQAWVSDITYVSTKQGSMYLFLITDAYSKQIMGSYLSENMKVESATVALKEAISNRRYPGRELIHHSDRGFQYYSPVYIEMLQKNDIKPSMTTRHDPYENAIAERVNGILKDEFDVGGTFPDPAMARRETKTAIEIYNYERPHRSCEMMTPCEAHQWGNYKLKKWKKRILSPVATGDKN